MRRAVITLTFALGACALAAVVVTFLQLRGLR